MTLAIAVFSLTRDRLDYTKHCFNSLHEYAGIEFDHYVLDNGSQDGTPEWLEQQFDENAIQCLVLQSENVGICRGLNQLLERTSEMDDYDVIVKVDNDCELTQPNTLRDIASLVLEGGCILSPRILGLRQPPKSVRELHIGGEIIQDVPQIGGIFMAVPAWNYTEFGFRYDESQMIYDDVQICAAWRQRGGTCGYVKRFEAWHYETTDRQHFRYPSYFARKYEEMGVAS
jgi:GT2 family glycosyltransferase